MSTANRMNEMGPVSACRGHGAHRLRVWQMLAALLLTLSWQSAALAQVLEQQIELRPGWNAIHVELTPENNDIAAVFAGLPVASVWQFRPDPDGAQFIRNPADGLENLDGWFGWFPEPRPEAFLSQLFAISANTSYLVRLEGSSTRTLRLRGRPSFRPPQWIADGFTLTGLPVSSTSAPTFADFFSASPAHVGEPIYRLSNSGQWERISAPASTRIEAGRAYWIHTRGNSSYQGRLHLVLEQGQSLEYSAALDESRVVLRNFSGLPGTFQVRRLGSSGMPISYLNEDPETGETGWPDLQQTLLLDAPPAADVFLSLGVRRSLFSADRMEEVLEISDELGQRVLLAVGANTTQPLAQLRAGAAGKGAAPAKSATALAGLWVGNVEITAVSEAQRAGTEPRPVLRPFAQRMILHVDAGGSVRLLKDVIQMWQDGSYRPSSIDPNFREVDQPGRHVLITEPSLIPLYTGPSNRDGQPVGLRVSTVAYDFVGTSLELNGDFGPGGQVSGSLVLPSDLPTNPFLHRYHPDHDNLDPQFLNRVDEAYQVVRNLRFDFVAEDPSGTNPPGWGDRIVGGTFSESISGLHKNPIFLAGRFRFERISAVSTLNQ